MIFWTTLLVIHGLFALALLGAITHQSAAFILGAWIYTQYRFTARVALEQLRFFRTVGVFELKEHLATIGSIVLPAYWTYWRQPLTQDYANARRHVSLLLAILVWCNFQIGHVVNNARGMGS